jgi:hypothetical protein
VIVWYVVSDTHKVRTATYSSWWRWWSATLWVVRIRIEVHIILVNSVLGFAGIDMMPTFNVLLLWYLLCILRDMYLCCAQVLRVGEPDVSHIDIKKARFPCCLVWTPLPIVAWLVPFIGHVGICREDGVILDFAGPCFVNVDNFAFGSTAKYLRLNPEKVSI